MPTAIDPAAFLRVLARELDSEADRAGQECACPTHIVTRHVMADLAATYRTRALHYLAAHPERPPDELSAAQTRLYEGLERADRWHRSLRESGVGPVDTRGLFRMLAEVIEAHRELKRVAE